MEFGGNFVIETSKGIVGLWTCWLRNQFALYYPLDVQVPDALVMKTLGVTYGQPVENKKFGTRKWAKYYAERLPEGGRVWIEQDSQHPNSSMLKTIENGKLVSHYCGHYETNTISTSQFTFCCDAEPDAPNARPENIVKYFDKFVQLLVEIAKLVGDIKAIDLESGGVLYTPITLERQEGKIKRFSKDSIGYCYTKQGNAEIILKEGNEIVPWITVIRYPATNDLMAQDLLKLWNRFDNKEIAYNILPLLNFYVEQSRIYSD